MKKLFYLFFLCFLTFKIEAQDDKFTECTYAYFKGSKKVSASICYDKDQRWGKARAYNKEGKIIFEKELRKIGGHSSVYFSYHANGAVSKAEWSSAPDGGIQWYKSTDEYSPEGEHTNHTELSNDRRATVMVAPDQKPSIQPGTETKNNNPEEARYAEIYVSEFLLINRTKSKLTIVCKHKNNKEEKYSLLIAPGDTLKGGQLILAEQYKNPISDFNITISKGKKKSKKEIKTHLVNETTIRKGIRKYYFEVR